MTGDLGKALRSRWTGEGGAGDTSHPETPLRAKSYGSIRQIWLRAPLRPNAKGRRGKGTIEATEIVAVPERAIVESRLTYRTRKTEGQQNALWEETDKVSATICGPWH